MIPRLIILLEKILNMRIRGSLTIHFDGQGGFTSEYDLKLKETEINKLAGLK